MRVVACALRDFRCYRDARVELGAQLTVVSGVNGAGKTNLLEGLYVGCTGRSWRAHAERELVRFGATSARVVVWLAGEDGAHQLTVALSPGEPKRLCVDGAAVERLAAGVVRPLVSVFVPDRLALVKGPPAVRRAHLDQLVAALWPARVATRHGYAQALAQRNALLARIRAGARGRGAGGTAESLTSWDAQLARHGVPLMADRARAAAAVSARFARIGMELGLEGELELAYQPASRATTVEQLAAELAERLELDIRRGFTVHGPHRDELLLRHEGRELRAYGSQGQHRLALLALLLAERDALAEHHGVAPLLLLDDVMSELDCARRRRLAERLRAAAGQTVLTTTDLDHVPGARDPGVVRLAVADGEVVQEPRGERAAA